MEKFFRYIFSDEFENLMKEFLYSTGISVLSLLALPEVKHTLSVCVSAFLGTVVIHYTKKILK